MAKSFHFKGRVRYFSIATMAQDGAKEAVIKDIIDCAGHTAPLMQVKYENEECLLIAPEGIRAGDKIKVGKSDELKPGDIAYLSDIPVGMPIFNLESKPGDGGKFVRASGTFARIVTKTDTNVLVRLPSKNVREFGFKCRATIGRIAGSGRTEMPFLKAGAMHHKMKVLGKLYPRTKAVSMNAVDHPYGGSSSATKGRPTIAPKNAPPGRKVGKIRPRRTGHKR